MMDLGEKGTSEVTEGGCCFGLGGLFETVDTSVKR